MQHLILVTIILTEKSADVEMNGENGDAGNDSKLTDVQEDDDEESDESDDEEALSKEEALKKLQEKKDRVSWFLYEDILSLQTTHSFLNCHWLRSMEKKICQEVKLLDASMYISRIKCS